MEESPSAFWMFAVTLYADPVVQAECVGLQDEFDVDVNVLLFCAFAGASRGVLLSSAQLQQAEDYVAPWRNDVVKPLRAVRRALKPFATGPAAAAALRNNVKALELEAERVECAMLETWSIGHLSNHVRADPGLAVSTNVDALLTIHAARDSRPNHLIAAAISRIA
jgi:uncharacterized protein (TIGR02444 family)